MIFAYSAAMRLEMDFFCLEKVINAMGMSCRYRVCTAVVVDLSEI